MLARKEHRFSNDQWQAAKLGAKRRNLIFKIKREDFIIPDVCPALGIPIDYRDTNHKPSLDRIDNTKGYVLGNVIVVSLRANRIKSDLTLSEIKKMGEFYASFIF